MSTCYLLEQQRNNLLLSDPKSHHSWFRPLDGFISSSCQTLFNMTPKFYSCFFETASSTRCFQAEMFACFVFSRTYSLQTLILSFQITINNPIRGSLQFVKRFVMSLVSQCSDTALLRRHLTLWPWKWTFK